jgi:hypothetical protein
LGRISARECAPRRHELVVPEKAQTFVEADTVDRVGADGDGDPAAQLGERRRLSDI